jgi:hypothetical protein
MNNPLELKGRIVRTLAPVTVNLRLYPAGTTGTVTMVSRSPKALEAQIGIVWTLDIKLAGGQTIQAKLTNVEVL